MARVPERRQTPSKLSDQRQGSMRPNWCSQIGSEWASGQMRHEFRKPGKAFGIHGASELRPIRSRFDCTSQVAWTLGAGQTGHLHAQATLERVP